MGHISELIKDVINKNQSVTTFAAKVILINKEEHSLHNDEDAYTINVQRIDGAIIKNVRLKSSILDKEEGCITIPKESSWVLVSCIDGADTRAFVSQFSEIDRTFIRIKNKNNQYLEIDTKANLFEVHFKEKIESNTTATTPPTKPEYKSIAKLEFNGVTESPNPEITTTFFDTNGKAISKNTFNGKQQQTVLSTINGENVVERIKTTLTTEGTSSAEMLFLDADGAEKQKITGSETQTQFAFTEGYQTVLTKDKASFKKDKLTFEMDDKFKITAGSVNLKAELDKLLDGISVLTVPTPAGPSSTPINATTFTGVKSQLDKLLK